MDMLSLENIKLGDICCCCCSCSPRHSGRFGTRRRKSWVIFQENVLCDGAEVLQTEEQDFQMKAGRFGAVPDSDLVAGAGSPSLGESFCGDLTIPCVILSGWGHIHSYSYFEKYENGIPAKASNLPMVRNLVLVSMRAWIQVSWFLILFSLLSPFPHPCPQFSMNSKGFLI